MARELFVYWKVPAPYAVAAISAAQALQDTLLAAHPGLQAQLFQRLDDAAPHAAAVTVMETYTAAGAHPAGIDTALQAAIADAAATALAGLPIGKRHVEVFDRVPR